MNFLLATIALWLLSSAPAAGQAAPARQLMSEQAFKNVPAGIKQAMTRPVGSTSIDDKDVMLVQGTANGGRSSIKLYFDKQSGLLVPQVRFADTIIERVPIQVDYSDYRDVAGAGVRLPFHVITTWTASRSDVLLTSAETNVAIDAAKFNQPTPPAPRKQ
jgi:hypothetical protein